MSSIVNFILVGLGIVTSLATVFSAITPVINQYIYKEQLDPKAKERQRKIALAVFGLSLISTVSIFGIASILPQSSAASFPIKGTVLYHFRDKNNDDIKSFAWSPDSTRIASVSGFEGTINVSDSLTGNHEVTYQPPDTFVNSLSWSPDGKYIAVNVEGHLYILDAENFILRRVFVLNAPLLSVVNSVIAWSPDGAHIAVACSDHTIRIWNVVAGQLDMNQKPFIYTQHSGQIYALAWSPDGQYIVSTSTDNIIQVWNIAKGDKVYRTVQDNTLNNGDTYLYSNIAWSPDSTMFATQNGTGTVSIWSLDGGFKVQSIDTHPKVDRKSIVYKGGEIAWSPDGRNIATGIFYNDFGGIQIVNWATGTASPVFTDNDLEEPVYALAWSPNGNYIAAATGILNGIIVWQARGVNSKENLQIFQTSQDSGLVGGLKLEGIPILMLVGCIILLEPTVFRSKKAYLIKKRNNKWKIIHVILSSRITWFFFVLIAGFSLSLYILNTLYIFFYNLAFLGLIIGCVFLVSYIIPSVAKIVIWPSLQRRHIFKRTSGYFSDGRIQIDQGNYRQAIEDYDHILALNPNSVTAYVHRGDAYAKQGEFQWAIEDYDRALKLQNKNDYVYYRRGLACFSLKEYQQAIENYNQAVELNPYKALTYFNRAMAYLWLKNISQAKVDYIRSNDLDPKNIDAAWKAVWAGIGKQRVDKEIAERLEQIAAIDPQHYIAQVCRGVALGLKGKVKFGLKEMEKAILLAPKSWDAYFWRGMLHVYYYGGKPRATEAKTMIEQSLAAGLPPILLVPLYWLEKDYPDEFLNMVKPLLVKENM